MGNKIGRESNRSCKKCGILLKIGCWIEFWEFNFICKFRNLGFVLMIWCTAWRLLIGRQATAGNMSGSIVGQLRERCHLVSGLSIMRKNGLKLMKEGLVMN